MPLLLDFPNEILDKILDYVRPSGFENFALSCKFIHELADLSSAMDTLVYLAFMTADGGGGGREGWAGVAVGASRLHTRKSIRRRINRPAIPTKGVLLKFRPMAENGAEPSVMVSDAGVLAGGWVAGALLIVGLFPQSSSLFQPHPPTAAPPDHTEVPLALDVASNTESDTPSTSYPDGRMKAFEKAIKDTDANGPPLRTLVGR
ncbi:hypothetical protein BDR22DRAFT_891455 [Usnea florida]